MPVEIMIIDDNDENLYAIHEILQYKNYSPIDCKNVNEALKYLNNHIPRIIILNAHMPRKKIFDKIKDNKKINIIYFTSFNEKIDIDLFGDSLNIIHKNIDIKSLMKKIKKIISGY